MRELYGASKVQVTLTDEAATPLKSMSRTFPYLRGFPSTGDVFILHDRGFEVSDVDRLAREGVCISGDFDGYATVTIGKRAVVMPCKFSHVCGFSGDKVRIDWHAPSGEKGDVVDAWIIYF